MAKLDLFFSFLIFLYYSKETLYTLPWFFGEGSFQWSVCAFWPFEQTCLRHHDETGRQDPFET
tara:strand:+ start:2418 stop:2606 length:189 start_codon:yes stop_codon:yes gene_type:complete